MAVEKGSFRGGMETNKNVKTGNKKHMNHLDFVSAVYFVFRELLAQRHIISWNGNGVQQVEFVAGIQVFPRFVSAHSVLTFI